MGHLFLITLSLALLTFPGLGQAQNGTTVPLVISLYDLQPETLEDIEKLVDYRWFEKALKALEKFPREEKVLFLEGRALMGLHKYREAASIFQQLTSQAKDPVLQLRSLYFLARSLSRAKSYLESLKIYEVLIQKERSRGRRQTYAMSAFKTALEGKEYKKGLHYLQSISGPQAYWYRGWCHFRLQQYARALANWKIIHPKRGKDFYPRSLYWRAHVLQKQGKREKANELLDTLIQDFPLSYYGYLALFEKNGGQKKRKLEILNHWTSKEPEGYLKKYPRDYFPLVEREAKKRGIEPYLILALMRQESYFQEAVVSNAGAIGLMQVMPQTALELAQGSWLKKDFKLTDIFDPEVNIHLGSLYLKFLKKLFRGKIPMMLASYNAGEESVRRWLLRRSKDPILSFIEEIPYEETQKYVKRILTNYWVYHWIYRNQLPKDLF